MNTLDLDTVTEFVRFDLHKTYDYGNVHSCPVSHDGWGCTRPVGHTKAHVAGVGNQKVIAAWPNKDDKPTIKEETVTAVKDLKKGDKIKVTRTTTQTYEADVAFVGTTGVTISGGGDHVLLFDEEGVTVEVIQPAVPEILPVGTVVLYTMDPDRSDNGPFVQTAEGWQHLITGRTNPGTYQYVARTALANAVRRGDAKITYSPEN